MSEKESKESQYWFASLFSVKARDRGGVTESPNPKVSSAPCLPSLVHLLVSFFTRCFFLKA